ncbi:uncharacterized protein [Salminus brasiliensis]|uniref:uncharacterized protein n=1 Tax=Salminus brasiliensis TaxID=930266 RepID=UPI003B835CF5
MRLFAACHFLFIFTTGNFLSGVRGGCGGNADVLEEGSGSLRYSVPAGLQSKHLTYDRTANESAEEGSNVTCTWIINAQENQTVWIDVVHIDEDTSLRIRSVNETTVQGREEGVLFTGAGRTTVEWSWRNGSKALRTLHLRWNTSEDGHDPAQVPYTHSDNDPVSPSPDAPNRVTHAPDILGFGSGSPSARTLQSVSVQQGVGVSGSDDKTGAPIPQEGTHNGQEKAGAAISDLAHTVTHWPADTHTQSALSYTQAETSGVARTAPPSPLASAEAESPQLFAHTSAGHEDEDDDGDVAMATSTHLNRETDSAYTVAQTQALTKRSPPTDSNKQTGTKIYAELHNSTEGTLLNSAGSAASSHTIDSVTEIDPRETDSTVQGVDNATTSDLSMTTSIDVDDDEGVSLVTVSQPNVTTLANTPHHRTSGPETGQPGSSLRSAPPNQDVSEQTQTSAFDPSSIPSIGTPSQADVSSQSGASESPFSRTLPTGREETPLTEQHTFETQPPNTHLEHTTQSTPSVSSLDLTSSTLLPDTANPSKPSTNPSSAFPTTMPTTPSDLLPSLVTSDRGSTSDPALTSPSPNSEVRPDGESGTSSTTFAPGSTSPSGLITTPRIYPTLTPDLTVATEEPRLNTSDWDSHTQLFTRLPHTLSPRVATTAPSTGITTAAPQSTDFSWTEHSTNDISHANSSQSGISLGPMIPVSLSPSISTESGPTEPGHSSADLPATTESNDPVTPANHSPVIGTAGEAVSTSMPSHWGTSKTPVVNSPSRTTQWVRIPPTPTPHHLTTALQTRFPIQQPSTLTPTVQMNTTLSQPGSNTTSTPVHNPTSWLRPVTRKADKDWSHKARVFVVEDQPAMIKVETFQVLLQVVLEGSPPSYVGLMEVEPFLHRVAGYQSQQVTWHSGPVLQTVVTFHTVEALPWLGRVESLLHEAGLSPLPTEGIFVGGARVKNITVGGLHTDVCSWLFTCPSGFQCVSSEGNASCRSLCHSEYCKHQGICVHRSGQQPLCQCPVGEDFWFMGQRCDLRMTRQRLVGVCFGVLLAVALLMAALSYLAVRRFKTMLVQAKVDQTRSSYRRFNHFDELSARFWGRSWPGSEDSLDNPAFTRSDELLHMRALDRTCCYHDDTLSITSTYQGSASHLNTVYPHSSQYRWDLSNYSLADGVVDSGKASDLSVCSWPIEPIQWTPFPLLQQLSRNTASVKASRPRSYCEGMELVDLEKSWTA